MVHILWRCDELVPHRRCAVHAMVDLIHAVFKRWSSVQDEAVYVLAQLEGELVEEQGWLGGLAAAG